MRKVDTLSRATKRRGLIRFHRTRDRGGRSHVYDLADRVYDTDSVLRPAAHGVFDDGNQPDRLDDADLDIRLANIQHPQVAITNPTKKIDQLETLSSTTPPQDANPPCPPAGSRPALPHRSSLRGAIAIEWGGNKILLSPYIERLRKIRNCHQKHKMTLEISKG